MVLIARYIVYISYMASRNHFKNTKLIVFIDNPWDTLIFGQKCGFRHPQMLEMPSGVKTTTPKWQKINSIIFFAQLTQFLALRVLPKSTTIGLHR